MGDLGAVDGKAVALEEGLVVKKLDSLTISKDFWAAAEEAAQELVNCIQPTLDSEEKRKDVIDYVHRLLKRTLGFEVFPYGSVPLKTYLPDGDIDLTALSNPCVEEFWASEVLSVLQGEEQSENAEYEVKDTQFIDAEVKIVKCLVQDIVIDISFNQLGGICTLCFLEQVDRLVGKNHLFKRSIILIKAWCYYESRILGAYHGLLSTYALETLVLYIFQLFHSSLDGPLAVLYKFLDYFSRFDWDNYCISVNGPVCKSSLPDIVVEMPENHGNNLMLGEEFLRNCVEMFAVPSTDLASNSRIFPPKHLNIIDPLKEWNNLGRSVHRGNFFRIRSAFKYGARKLGTILSLPIEEIEDEIKKFFSNTLQRHLYKTAYDLEVYSPFSLEGSHTLHSLFSSEGFSEDDMCLRSYTRDFENEGLETKGKCSSLESGRSFRQLSSKLMSEPGYPANGLAASGMYGNGNSNGIVACSSLDFRGLSSISDCSSSSYLSNSYYGQYYYAPQFYLYKPSPENGPFYQTGPSDVHQGKPAINQWERHRESQAYMVDTYQSCADNLDGYWSCSSVVSSPKTSMLESLSLDFRERDAGSLVDTEPLNPLADLTGDYDSHIRSLLYWQCCCGLAFFAPTVPMTPALPSQFPRNKVWDSVHQSATSGPSSTASVSVKTSVYASEGNGKTGGVCAYLPSLNSSCMERSVWRTRDREPGSDIQLQKGTCSNVNIPCFVGTSCSTKSSPTEAMNAQIPFQAHKTPGPNGQRNHSETGNARANGSFSNSSCRIEFGSLGVLADEVIFGSAYSNGLKSPTTPQDKGSLMPGSDTKKERDADRLFLLKNDKEFPALSL